MEGDEPTFFKIVGDFGRLSPLLRISFRLDRFIITHFAKEKKGKYASINKRRMLQPYTRFLLHLILSYTLV